MARKKKDRESHSGPYNPYFGKFEDESQMAKRPFFTWILVVPGAVLGVFIGMKVQEPVLGPVFGGIMGIAVWAVYGLVSRIFGNTLSTMAAIGVGVVVYAVLVVVLKAISREDLSLMPKGDKIAKLLRL